MNIKGAILNCTNNKRQFIPEKKDAAIKRHSRSYTEDRNAFEGLISGNDVLGIEIVLTVYNRGPKSTQPHRPMASLPQGYKDVISDSSLCFDRI